jgi:hypothetical protein
MLIAHRTSILFDANYCLNALLAGRDYDNVGIRIHWKVLYVLALAPVPEPRPKSFLDYHSTSTPPRLQFRVEIKERRLPSKRRRGEKRKEEEKII